MRGGVADEEGPQTGWVSRVRHRGIARILAHALILIVILFATIAVRRAIPQGPGLRHDLLILVNLASAVLLVAGYAWSVRWIERRRADEVDPGKGAAQFLAGVALGVGLMAAVYLVLWGLGLATFARGTGVDGLGAGLAAYFAGAVLEELLFRAVLFRIVEQMTGTTIAVLSSAMLFGLAHGANPGATPMAVAGVAIEAGLTLALGYALTRNLWLVIGIHLGWNFAEGGLFGAQVSGTADAHSLLRTSLSGPEILTGGDFGPEASLVAIGLFLVVAAAFARITVRNGGWRPREFRLRLP